MATMIHYLRYALPFFLTVLGLYLEASMEVCCYTNARVLWETGWREDPFWTCEGKIIAPQDHADRIVDLVGQLLVPGYIDLQINGAFGVDFATEPERVAEVAAQLPQHGVTAFIPTVVSSERSRYPQLIQELQPRKGNAKDGAIILGVHLEGPFLNRQQQGAHEERHLIHHPPENLATFYGSLEGVRLVTMAPELPGALATISSLQAQGIAVAIGHSSATYAESVAAAAAGATMVTHLYNAMTPFHHRKPGMIGFILGDQGLMYSVIVDGLHLDPASIRMAWRSHPQGLILVTDAMAALGLEDGLYLLGEKPVEVIQGAAYVAGTRTLAGSVLRMDRAVKSLHQITGCSIEQAIEAASLRPAQVLNIQDKKGSLAIGKDADFLVLDRDLTVQACYIAGACAYSRH